MNKPVFADGSVAQAVYTWSRTLVDGRVGMGFSAISPALVGSIDWLGRLDPSEFGLFEGDVTGASSDLIDARKGFSEVGRKLVDDVAIVYRKTADGEISQGGRPHPVVHVLVAQSGTLDFSSMARVRDEFWIRKVDGSGSGGSGLTDLTLADILVENDGFIRHSCPADHQAAEDILRAVAERSFERDGAIDLQDGNDAIAGIALAFPPEVANGFSLTAYVAIGGVNRRLVLKVPTTARSAQVAPSRPGREGTAQDRCPLEHAVYRAARQFLSGESPNLSRYAQAALLSDQASAPVSTPPPRPPWEYSTSIAQENPVLAHLNAVREGAGGLTDAENKDLLGRLLAAGIGADSVLELSPGTLAEMFAEVATGEVIWAWNRRLFADTGAEIFLELWNKTRVGAFLGIVLVKNLAASQGAGIRVTADKGLTPRATAAILRSMQRYDGGGRSIGRIISWGFGDTEATRVFIAETFSDKPKFLFDAILADAEVPPAHMVDYIRSCYQSWAAYRGLPERESVAINQALKLTLIQRLKVMLGR